MLCGNVSRGKTLHPAEITVLFPFPTLRSATHCALSICTCMEGPGPRTSLTKRLGQGQGQGRFRWVMMVVGPSADAATDVWRAYGHPLTRAGTPPGRANIATSERGNISTSIKAAACPAWTRVQPTLPGAGSSVAPNTGVLAGAADGRWSGCGCGCYCVV